MPGESFLIINQNRLPVVGEAGFNAAPLSIRLARNLEPGWSCNNRRRTLRRKRVAYGIIFRISPAGK
jgi:hypothetical protein